MAYCTNTDVKNYLNISGSGDDALLTTLISRAQQMIDTFTDTTFEASGDTTHYLDTLADVDGDTLYLDAQLAQITTVTNGDSVTVAANEYTTLPRNTAPYHALKLLASANKSWTYSDDPEGAISVTGRWAYSVTPPADIAQTCVELAAWLYHHRDNLALAGRLLVSAAVNCLL